MSNSKPLKDFSIEKSSRLYDWWVESSLYRPYTDFMWKFIESPIFQVKRMYQWYVNVFRHDVDFDAMSLFAIIEYKLKRVERSLIDYGTAWQEPKDMKALRLAIKLAGRLKEDKYDSIVQKLTDSNKEKKWGKNFIFDYSKYSQSRAEFHVLALTADVRMKREERWLYSILQNHLRVWWD